MTHKVKSVLYFASLVIALIAYNNMDNENNLQNNQMANNTIERVTFPDALN